MNENPLASSHQAYLQTANQDAAHIAGTQGSSLAGQQVALNNATIGGRRRKRRGSLCITRRRRIRRTGSRRRRR